MPKVPDDIGVGAAHLEQIHTLLKAAVDDLNSLKAQVDDLQAKYNQHIADGKHQVATAADALAPTSDTTSTVTLTK
jgi:F0F1-type ATP synthase membrane subunit b/b'